MQIRLLDSFSGPTTASGDTDAISTGIEFVVSEACDATAVWWWQAPSGTVSTATRSVGIYPVSGTATLLGSGTAAPSGTGWQRVQLSAPVSLSPGSYIAAVHHPGGQYSATPYWWQSAGEGGSLPGASGVTDGILSAPSEWDSTAGQQRFSVGASLTRPSTVHNESSYWVDVEVSTEDPATPLDTPVVTVTEETNPSTSGGSDGSIEITWTTVANADRYEVGIAAGHDQTTGFTQIEDDATSPFVITGRAAGDFTVAVRAHPAE